VDLDKAGLKLLGPLKLRHRLLELRSCAQSIAEIEVSFAP